MFSGIVEGQGILSKIRKGRSGARVWIQHDGLGSGVKIGHSEAVDGCCLTVVANRQKTFEFDVLNETWERTTLSRARPPVRVNLERAMRCGDPVGGHFVTGHIDGVGKIASSRRKGADIYLEVEAPRSFLRWILPKGSVAIDGVSLTVAKAGKKSFSVWLIPHTLKLTTLGWKRQGDDVNLEADMLAKYAQKS